MGISIINKIGDIISDIETEVDVYREDAITSRKILRGENIPEWRRRILLKTITEGEAIAVFGTRIVQQLNALKKICEEGGEG